MRRSLPALTAALLLLTAWPAASLAIATDTLDQENNSTATGLSETSEDIAQTFMAGKSGLVDRVSLLMGNVASGSMFVTLYTIQPGGIPGSPYAGSQSVSPVVTGPTWVDFDFSVPQPVVRGGTYALVFNASNLSSTSGYPLFYGSTTDTYSGGAALGHGGSWGPLNAGFPDFSFRTYVNEQTTTLAWSQTSLNVGVSTPLTLTETIDFPNYQGVQGDVVVPNAKDATYEVKPQSLPTWFTVAGVTCADTTQILLADCTVQNATDPAHSIPVTSNGNPFTIVLTGTAHPAAADVGTVHGQAEGCVDYLLLTGTVTSCVTTQANITVGGTAPPTTTTGNSGRSPDESGLALLLAAFIAASAGALLACQRRPVIR